MDAEAKTARVAAEQLLDLYPRALPVVYGFLCSRCGDTTLAEDLAAETFFDAVRAVRGGTSGEITVAWLIVVARRRLVDHWRHQAVEDRHLQQVGQTTPDAVDPWDDHLDVVRTRAALDRLGPHHRAALTLRYLDGLPVAEVAENLGRGLHATEALLQRARRALRVAYVEGGTDAG
ncbi:MAG TPA: sigma-70 family RNA polymerase sigma factor [Acidimicrobiales bacterium]|jgi:RNA polymerase sigma-70 factor (ECF subfamily)